MKYRIGICDDDKLQIKLNKVHIQDYMKQEGYKIEIESYTSYEELLKAIQKKSFHILFLDIDLGQGEKNGMELAKIVYEQCPQTLFVFITGYADYTADAFGVEAMGYLLKPVDIMKMKRVLERCMWQLQREQKEEKFYLVVVENKIRQKILQDSIIRMERKLRKTIIYTDRMKYEVYEAMVSIEERLEKHFIRISQSDLVNKRKIQSMEKGEVVMQDGTKLRIGRTYLDAVYGKYFGENK